MVKISYLNIPPGLEDAYARGLQPGDRFTFSRTRVKSLFTSRLKIKGLSIKSQLVALSPVWAALSAPAQAAWVAAGLVSGLTGWKMFVADTTARKRNGTAGYATPNTIYQSMVGRILISSPSTGLRIEQAHPLTYYVNHKVVGTRDQYKPVAVTEPFSFPLALAISYKTALTSTGSGTRARFYAVIISSYQGTNLQTFCEITFGLTDSWQKKTASISAVKGMVISYEIFIELFNCRGNLYFDNVEITHGSQNWARDPACNNIAQEFTKAFFQVARHWAPVNPNTGAQFGSVYFVP